ncbi:MAG: type I-B CRISPR-associated protein Cas7/Cst2/DevR [Hydrogenothermaceae bacterium]
MKAITFTIVTHKAQSLNYGETIGNVSTLKKLTIGNSIPKKLITYVSDKALKYDIKRIGRDSFGWKLMDQSVLDVMKSCVSNIKKDKGDFDYDKFYKEMITNYEEFDLFGGMFADIEGIGKYDSKSKTYKLEINNKEISVKIDTTKLQRTAPVRITNAHSISEFANDSNLLNDIDAYNRYIQYTAGRKNQTLAYSDEHKSYYTYTILIDLDRIGCIEKIGQDGKIQYECVLDNTTRKKRIESLLQILFLCFHRNIRGRVENLAPIFAIGGVYDIKHPIFHNAIRFYETDNGLKVSAEDIENICKNYSFISMDNTFVYHNNEVDLDLSVSNLTKKDVLKEIIDNIVKNIP